MGRKVTVREDYVRDVQSVYRLREALRIDPSVTSAEKTQAMDACTSLMKILMSIDERKTDAGRQTKGQGSNQRHPKSAS